jgi:hypothetical protein
MVRTLSKPAPSGHPIPGDYGEKPVDGNCRRLLQAAYL